MTDDLRAEVERLRRERDVYARDLARTRDAHYALRDAVEVLADAANAFLLAPQVAQRENRLREALEGAREALK